MSAVAFQAEFVKRFRCRLDLSAGVEFSGSAERGARGLACVGCDGCDMKTGVVGLAGEGVSLVKSQSGLDLVWNCPGCGCEVTEETSALQSLWQAAEVKADGLCYKCRRRGKVG
jgi:hypothetical protein